MSKITLYAIVYVYFTHIRTAKLSLTSERTASKKEFEAWTFAIIKENNY